MSHHGVDSLVMMVTACDLRAVYGGRLRVGVFLTGENKMYCLLSTTPSYRASFHGRSVAGIKTSYSVAAIVGKVELRACDPSNFRRTPLCPSLPEL